MMFAVVARVNGGLLAVIQYDCLQLWWKQESASIQQNILKPYLTNSGAIMNQNSK